MKKIICGILSLVLLIGCLAGCSAGETSTGETSSSRFVDLPDGERAFNFTVDNFKAMFNAKVDESAQIGEWQQHESSSETDYLFDYGDGARLYVTADSDSDNVKAVCLSLALLHDKMDSTQWGENMSSLLYATDITLDAETGTELLYNLGVDETDSWTIGHKSDARNNGIYYRFSLGTGTLLKLVIMPVPTDDTNVEQVLDGYQENWIITDLYALTGDDEDAESSLGENPSQLEEPESSQSTDSQPAASSMPAQNDVSSIAEEQSPAATQESSAPTANNSAPVQSQPVTSQTPTATGQYSALQDAKQYISVMPFSYLGLIEQLEYEGYSREDATYGADNCGADWNAQALLSAKKYLNTMPFSYSGLIDQLVYEQYTTEQATYGVDNCGADWNEQAAKSAEKYLSMMSFSRDELIAQLEFEGFTHDQAVYGAQANGY